MKDTEKFEFVYLPYDKEGMKSAIFREKKKQADRKYLGFVNDSRKGKVLIFEKL